MALVVVCVLLLVCHVLVRDPKSVSGVASPTNSGHRYRTVMHAIMALLLLVLLG